MNEDPTRRMEPARPPEDRDSGGMSNRARGLLALLVAAVVGLGVALAVIASGDGAEDDAPAVEATTTEEAGGEEPATELTDPAGGGETTTPGDEGGGGGQATQTETEPTGGVSPP